MLRISDMLGRVIDSYRIEAVLGKGGMGVVFKAVDTSLDKVVALKLMNPMLVEDERFLRRFMSEAKALGRLHHPNIVSVFALRHVEHHLFIVMEYVEGATLADHVKRRGPIPWPEALPIIRQTLEAIAYAHGQHIIHRDVKPHNILIALDGTAKLTDFGLAKIQASYADSRATTRTGFTGGTLYYMPPEQIEGLPNVDHRGDIYGLGMTYYEMLAGTTPFDKLSSEFAILKAIDAHDFPSLDQLNRDVPAPLVEIVMKAVERYPDDRYQSAAEALQAMDAWLAASPAATGEGHPAGPSPSVPATPRKQALGDSLASLKAALSQSARRYASVLRRGPSARATDADAAHKTVIARSPSKDASELSAAPPPVAPPVAPDEPPGEPPREPSRRPALGALRHVRERPVRMMGVVGAVLLLGLLLYLGTQGVFRAAPGTADDAAADTVETALLSIRTLPVAAEVFVDGDSVGSTPLIDYEIDAGTRMLRLEKPGYVALDTSITLAVGEAPAFTFALQEDTSADEAEPAEAEPIEAPPAPGTLTIRSEPAGAEVWLDGKNVGQTPLTVPDLKAGPHRLILRKQGFADHTRTITVAPGGENQATATLTSVVRALLRVTVRPLGDVYIDGMLKAQGTAEPYAEEFGAGVYRVRAMHPQFGTWDKQVTIDSSGTREVLFNFDQQFEVAVTSEPDGAEILVDGRPTETSTPGVVRVRPGQRTIAVRRSGYVMEGAARVITLERNRADRPLHFSLRAIN